jgi:hypothetical protein
MERRGDLHTVGSTRSARDAPSRGSSRGLMMSALDLRVDARRHMPTLPDLPYLVTGARRTWFGRMVNEYGSARVFEALAAQLEVAGLPAHIVAECKGFASEERIHGMLCGAVVEALGGDAFAEVPEGEEFPAHDDVPPLEAALRNLLSISCLSETVAVALIGAERLEMPEGQLRDVLTRIYADEVGHARFGWRLMEELAPTLAPKVKESLAEYLAVAFAHLEAHELSHLPANVRPPPEGVALGLCNGADARELFYDAVTEVIVPGLEALGIPAKRAWSERSLT